MDLGGLSIRLNARADEVPKAVNTIVKRAVLAIDQAVVLATPVDTGRARSNWTVTLLTPSLAERDPFAPGQALGIGERANAQAALDAARRSVSFRQPGQVVYINNNVSYIGNLNAGSSAQAPAMFVEMGVSAGVRDVAGATLNTNPGANRG